MKQGILVFLSYAPNNTVVVFTDMPPKGVRVDVRKGTWSYDSRAYKINNEIRLCNHGSRHGPIGAYDNCSVKNLNTMLYHIREALRQPSTIMDD